MFFVDGGGKRRARFFIVDFDSQKVIHERKGLSVDLNRPDNV